jgi:hypothetical protein
MRALVLVLFASSCTGEECARLADRVAECAEEHDAGADDVREDVLAECAEDIPPVARAPLADCLADKPCSVVPPDAPYDACTE